MSDALKIHIPTPEAIAQFTGWPAGDISKLINEGWTPPAIKRGIEHGLETTEAFNHLSMWSTTFLKKGNLWGNKPSETVELAVQKIPDDGKVLEVGFGYGRDLTWLAKRRARVMGIEKSSVGFSIAMNTLKEMEHTNQNGGSPKLGEVDLILASMKTHRFAKGSLSGAFSHRTVHLPHPETALPDIAQNMADAVKVGGVLVVSARSFHDFYQDQEKMKNVILDSAGFPRSAERSDRAGHKINYFNGQRFNEVFGPYCTIKELYIGKEPESAGNQKDGQQVYSYYMTAVMEVLPENERTFTFGEREPSTSTTELPSLKRLPSIPVDESIRYASLTPT